MVELTVKGATVRIEMSPILVRDFREKLGKTDEEIYRAYLNNTKLASWQNGD